MYEAPPPRRAMFVELGVCTVLVVLVSLFALWKMNYLSADTRHEVRMTDSARTAYVAKNIVEGRGYAANDLPAFLIDFYDQRGKLHEDNWVNADRFPFTAYAIAALYTVTGSTNDEVGILVYNAICFVALMVLLYALARKIWNDRWTALFTLLIALAHPLTYNYLYLKDGDMMLLTTGLIAVLFGHLARGREPLSWKRAIVVGTLLAWLMLDRPNIGGGFGLWFAIVTARRLWRLWREEGASAAIKSFARSEGVALGAFVLWCAPFVIYCLSEWGSPFFSANALYQRPLGTRFAMDTDTWWKYSQPGQSFSLGMLLENARHQVVLKFTTSWAATLQMLFQNWAVEILLGAGYFVWRARKSAAAPPEHSTGAATEEAAFRKLAGMIGFAVVVNFAILPLYGYQGYGYGHYLSFFLPIAWIACGRALSLFMTWIKPLVPRAVERIKSNAGVVAVIAVVGLLVWNFGVHSDDTNQLFVATAHFLSKHWLAVAIAVPLALAYRPISRWSPFLRGVIIVTALVVFLYRPNTYVKHLNLLWYPTDPAVYDVLRQRKGIVSSLSPQGEVSWMSDRRNIPVPELPMHIYSFVFDHQLEIEDIYLETAETMISPIDGVFTVAAPGFEGYARLQRYRGKVPGYDLVFYSAATKGYPKYSVKPRPKASSVYRLVDRSAVQAMAHSPDRVDLGSVDNVIYTAHGWGGYFRIDDKPAVAATDATRSRYWGERPMKPWEDTSATFFLDDRRPSSIDLEIYATHPTAVEFYWNLDLYYYDRTEDRKAHSIGTYTITHTGWQTVHLNVPRSVTRVGLNKLGFRAGEFQAITVCPPTASDAACAAMHQTDDEEPTKPRQLPPAIVVHDPSAVAPAAMNASLFVGALDLHYDHP